MTPQQRKALHKGLRIYAEELDGAGYSVQEVFTMPVRVTMENVKDGLYKRFMTAMYPEIESTEDLTTTQMTDVWDTMTAAVAQKFGVSVPFPSEEDEQDN